MNYTASTDPDIDDEDALIVVLRKPFLWLRAEGGSRTWPSTASTAHPIIVTDMQTSINAASGNRTITISAKHRYANL